MITNRKRIFLNILVYYKILEKLFKVNRSISLNCLDLVRVILLKIILLLLLRKNNKIFIQHVSFILLLFQALSIFQPYYYFSCTKNYFSSKKHYSQKQKHNKKYVSQTSTYKIRTKWLKST